MIWREARLIRPERGDGISEQTAEIDGLQIRSAKSQAGYILELLPSRLVQVRPAQLISLVIDFTG